MKKLIMIGILTIACGAADEGSSTYNPPPKDAGTDGLSMIEVYPVDSGIAGAGGEGDQEDAGKPCKPKKCHHKWCSQ